MYRTVCALAALVMTAGTVAFATPVHAAPADEAVAAACGTAEIDQARDPAETAAARRGGPFRLTRHIS